MLKDRKSYQIIDAKKVGTKEQEFIFGKHSGRGTVKNFFERKEISITDEQIEWIIEYVKQYANIFKREIIDEELLRIYHYISKHPDLH